MRSGPTGRRIGWSRNIWPDRSCYFSHAGKVTKRALKGSPLENPECFDYLPFAVAGLILPEVPALRLPLPSVYPQVLTGAKQRGECGADLPRSDSVGPPCRGYPFKRPAGVQWPTATSNPKPPVAAHGRSCSSASPPDQNPEGDFSFTGQRSSSLGSVSEDPPPRQAVPGSRHCRLWRQRPLGQRKRCLGRPREGVRGLPGAFWVTFCAHKK